MFCQANNEEMHLVSNILKDFCAASSIKVNLEKSRIFFSKNIPEDKQQQLSNILGFSRASNLGKYLGIPLS